jgi:hypothetical protein
MLPCFENVIKLRLVWIFQVSHHKYTYNREAMKIRYTERRKQGGDGGINLSDAVTGQRTQGSPGATTN